MQKNPDFIVFFLNLKYHDQYLVPEGQQLYCGVITLKSHVHIEALIKRWNLIGLIYKQKDEKEENFNLPESVWDQILGVHSWINSICVAKD